KTPAVSPPTARLRSARRRGLHSHGGPDAVAATQPRARREHWWFGYRSGARWPDCSGEARACLQSMDGAFATAQSRLHADSHARYLFHRADASRADHAPCGPAPAWGCEQRLAMGDTRFRRASQRARAAVLSALVPFVFRTLSQEYD